MGCILAAVVVFGVVRYLSIRSSSSQAEGCNDYLRATNADDLEQLDAGMFVYDAFYRWCRDATEETHNWPASKARS